MRMEKIFDIANPNLVEYWKQNGLTEKDFYCRECGKLLIDMDELPLLKFSLKPKSLRDRFIDVRTGQRFTESANSRWCLKGREMSGKVFFRHLCWDCFFKHLPEVEDIPRRARKGKWYAAVLRGEHPVPKSWTSPSAYFKLLFDITDEELNAERSKFDTASEESFIRRHGEEEGRRLYEEYRKRQAYTCSKDYMISERGMTEGEWNAYNKSRASTKKNFISRYGKELGEAKWKQYCDHEAYAGCALEYFVDTYGEKTGRAKYLELCAKKALTLENFISKYGMDEGKRRFGHLKNKSYSEVSQALFLRIDEQLGDLSLDSRYATKNAEEVINLFFDDGTCKTCRPDYKLNTKIIEFNGDFWHANTRYYAADEIIYTNGKRIVSDIWKADEIRKSALEKLGYRVLVIWEHDYYENPDKVVSKCVDFLKS